MIDTLKAWIQAGRAPFFVATLIPLGLGGMISAREGCWDLSRWLLVLSASFLVHLCTNLANDYFEFPTGADSGDSIGGSRVLQEGKITMSQIRYALILCYSAALVLGMWILWVSKVWWLAGFMAFAFFSSVFYTAPPIRYGWLGLGEVFVGLNMGLIMVVGTVAAVTGFFSYSALWLSIPVAVMVAMILFYQSLPDMEADKAVGKLTTAVRLGKERALWGIRLFLATAQISIVMLVWAGYLHPVSLLSLFSVFLAYKVDKMIRASDDWKDLHDRGGKVRMIYLFNGLTMIAGVYLR